LYLCTYLYPLFTHKLPDQSPPNFAQTSPPTQGRFLTQARPHKSDPWTLGDPKLQFPNGSLERKLCVTEIVQMGSLILLVNSPGSAGGPVG